jgi:hypothetical protein
VKAQIRRHPLDQEAAQREGQGVEDQMRETGVGVDAGDDRPGTSEQGQRQREHPAKSDQVGDLLDQEDAADERQRDHRRTPP